MKTTNSSHATRRTGILPLSGLGVLFASFPASAWAMTGALVDKAADILAVAVLLLVPIGAIYLFWMVHILPEKIAEKRHHPQKDAIKTLCLLSLVFGGMLWPLAWLWAYSKPVLYKLAYGTDQHEDAYREGDGEAASGPSGAEADARERLRRAINRLSAGGVSAEELESLKRELAAIENALALAKGREGAG